MLMSDSSLSWLAGCEHEETRPATINPGTCQVMSDLHQKFYSQPASEPHAAIPNNRIRAKESDDVMLKGYILVQGADTLPEEVWLHILSRVTEGNYGRTEASVTSKSWRHLCRRTYRSMHIDTRKGEAWQVFCTWLQLFGNQLTQLQLSDKEREYYRYNPEQRPEGTDTVWSALMAHGSHLQLQQLLVQVALAPAEAAQMYQACIQAPALWHLSLLPTSGCLQGLSSLTQLQSLQLGAADSSSSTSALVITAADLTLLANLTRLTTLQFYWCTFTSAVGSPDLGLLTSVQHLVLEDVSIRSQEDDGHGWNTPPAAKLALAKHLSDNFAKLTGLKSFRVTDGSDATTSAFLVAAPSLTALQQVELLPAPQHSNAQPAPLAALSHLCSISRLSVADTSTLQIQAAALFRQKPAFCSALVSLDVDDCQLTSINSLSDLRCLTYLSASNNPLTTFAALSSFQQLRHLSLRKTLEARPARVIASEAWLAVAELGQLSWLEFTARKQQHSRNGGHSGRGPDKEEPLNRVFHWDFTPSFIEKRLTVADGSGQSHRGGFGYQDQGGYGYGSRGDELNEAVHNDSDHHQYGRYSGSRSDDELYDEYEDADHVTRQENQWDVPVSRRMPRCRHRSSSPAALAQWSSLHHLHLSLDMLPDVAAAKSFQRSLLSAFPHLSELHLVSSDGYKQGLGMVGVAGFRWVQEVSLCACELLDTGCFRYFAALPGVTRLVISDPMPESYNPKWGTEREQAMKELQKGLKMGSKTTGEQACEVEQENDKWEASEDQRATGNGTASGISTREAAELSGDSRRDDAEGDNQDKSRTYHRNFWVGKTPSSSHGSGGAGEDAARAPSPADGDVGGELGAVKSHDGDVGGELGAVESHHGDVGGELGAVESHDGDVGGELGAVETELCYDGDLSDELFRVEIPDGDVGGELGAVESHDDDGSRMSDGRAWNGIGREAGEEGYSKEVAGGEKGCQGAREVDREGKCYGSSRGVGSERRSYRSHSMKSSRGKEGVNSGRNAACNSTREGGRGEERTYSRRSASGSGKQDGQRHFSRSNERSRGRAGGRRHSGSSSRSGRSGEGGECGLSRGRGQSMSSKGASDKAEQAKESSSRSGSRGEGRGREGRRKLMKNPSRGRDSERRNGRSSSSTTGSERDIERSYGGEGGRRNEGYQNYRRSNSGGHGRGRSEIRYSSRNHSRGRKGAKGYSRSSSRSERDERRGRSRHRTSSGRRGGQQSQKSYSTSTSSERSMEEIGGRSCRGKAADCPRAKASTKDHKRRKHRSRHQSGQYRRRSNSQEWRDWRKHNKVMGWLESAGYGSGGDGPHGRLEFGSWGYRDGSGCAERGVRTRGRMFDSGKGWRAEEQVQGRNAAAEDDQDMDWGPPAEYGDWDTDASESSLKGEDMQGFQQKQQNAKVAAAEGRRKKQQRRGRKKIDVLDVRSMRMGSPSLWDLSNLPQLRHLEMNNCSFTDISCLSALQQLTHLAAAGNYLSRGSIQVIGHYLHQLQHLIIDLGEHPSQLSVYAACSSLSTLTGLTTLCIGANAGTTRYKYIFALGADQRSLQLATVFPPAYALPKQKAKSEHDSCAEWLQFLTALTNLQQLSLHAGRYGADCRVLAAALAATLSSAKQLQQLTLESWRFLDAAGLAGVAAFSPKLCELDLTHRPELVSPKGLRQLQHLTCMTRLVLSHNRLGHESSSRAGRTYCSASLLSRVGPLVALERLPQLLHLELDDCVVLDGTPLGSLSRLTYLSAAGNYFNSRNIQLLGNLICLHHLDLQYALAAGVSTAEVCAGVSPLSCLSYLRFSPHNSRGSNSSFSRTKRISKRLMPYCYEEKKSIALIAALPTAEPQFGPYVLWHFQSDALSTEAASAKQQDKFQSLHICVDGPKEGLTAAMKGIGP